MDIIKNLQQLLVNPALDVLNVAIMLQIVLIVLVIGKIVLKIKLLSKNSNLIINVYY